MNIALQTCTLLSMVPIPLGIAYLAKSMDQGQEWNLLFVKMKLGQVDVIRRSLTSRQYMAAGCIPAIRIWSHTCFVWKEIRKTFIIHPNCS
ncbi:hypothetical protein AVEN_30479-1 [Araneus ventricosus]|uniref:Uncharacterized protein n=1 Tax=Araneus ventricosus TaxID=182803 RepID=A0A4Y2TTW8_ARAVE|nr:hypothetical protein AVEN_30479-1 [Araneus ventricosus]